MIISLILALCSALPEGPAPAALETPWFPDALHTFVWRNWQVVPLERMAETVGAAREDIVAIGQRMGLGEPLTISENQLRRSYITIIRRNWHLLPYNQLLTLLHWTEEELAYTLREDDFLYVKLGSLKPKCAPLHYAPPDEKAIARAEEIGALMKESFPKGPAYMEKPLFSFVDELSAPFTNPDPTSTEGPPRICYSYFALYGDPLLDANADPYPDGYLARLASIGVNGVWLQAVLYKLAPFPWDPALSKDYETRLANLRVLVERAKKHGIGVYLYLNEPRAMPLEFFTKREGLRGPAEGDFAALCSSAPEVRNYLRDSVKSICEAVPDVAGFFTISASENLSNCWSHYQGKGCPRCAPLGAAKVIGDYHAALAEGLAAASSKARLIAWDWGWQAEWAVEAINGLPKSAALMSVSEWGIPIDRGGVKTTIGEYSLSVIGPGPRATKHWAAAREAGIKTMAKLQVGCTWELGSVPYIPVVANVAEHMANLNKIGLDGALLGWTLGGYPSPNLEVASLMLRKPEIDAEKAMTSVATSLNRSDAPGEIVKAWRTMSIGFQHFPFGSGLYTAPYQLGSANLLWPKETGYKATMVGLPYDDLDSWRGEYSSENFSRQLKTVSGAFVQGMGRLTHAGAPTLREEPPDGVTEADHAGAISTHLLSISLQAKIISMRNQAMGKQIDPEAYTEFADTIEYDMRQAIGQHRSQTADPRIGFEATNHYFYIPTDLAEKVINCDWLLRYWLPTLKR